MKIAEASKPQNNKDRTTDHHLDQTMNKYTKAVAAAIGVCLIGSTINISSFQQSSTEWTPRLRRALQGPDDGQPAAAPDWIYPWARGNLRPLSLIPDGETVVFWNIPKSGGTTVKSIYECLGRTLATDIGVDPRYGHQDKEEVIAFQPWPGVSKASYVNVDSTSRPGVRRARRMGLVPSGLADMIITGDPAFVVDELFDDSHRGRGLALFRHPIDRLVSKFFYLQKATWEEQYRPEWKNIDILEFARTRNTENNYMVKKLAGKTPKETATREDFQIAMRTIRSRFVVGLMDQMEESVHRFNVVMGVNEVDEDNQKCMDHFLHHSIGAKKHASNSHRKVAPGSATWNAFAKRNDWDVKLYDFILELFDEQRGIIESYGVDKVQSPEEVLPEEVLSPNEVLPEEVQSPEEILPEEILQGQ